MSKKCATDGRRLRVPQGVSVQYGSIPNAQCQWFGAIPLTAPLQTLNDCAAADVPPELLRAAATEALQRGLVERKDLAAVEKALEAFGGLLSCPGPTTPPQPSSMRSNNGFEPPQYPASTFNDGVS